MAKGTNKQRTTRSQPLQVRRQESAKERAMKQRHRQKLQSKKEQPVQEEEEEEEANSIGSSESVGENKEKGPRNSSACDEEDTDQELEREPLSQTFLCNRQDQRVNNHPSKMAVTRTGAVSKRKPLPKKGKKAQIPAPPSSGSDTEDQDPSNQGTETVVDERVRELEMEIYRMKSREKALSRKSGSRASKKSQVKGTVSAIVGLIEDTTKRYLFKVCKFLATEQQLVHATRKVMDELDLKELEDLKGKALVDAQQNWIVDNQEIVRKTLNDWRNYVQGELLKVVNWAATDDEIWAILPNKEQMLQIVLRNGLEGAPNDPNLAARQDQFDFYWDHAIGKVAGHANWGPGKKHHGLMSFMRQENDPNGVLFVTPSDEAFLVLLWENCYDRWMYDIKHAGEEGAGEEDDEEDDEVNEEADGSKKAAGGTDKVPKEADKQATKPQKGRKGKPKQDDEDEDSEDDEEEEVPEEDAQAPDGEKKKKSKRPEPPYTLPKGGVLRFGGWNKAGRKRYRELLEMIKASKENANLKAVETAALQRIRAKHNCDEREAKRKRPRTEGEVEVIDSDHEVDWL